MAHSDIPGGSSVHRIRFYPQHMRRSVQVLPFLLLFDRSASIDEDGDLTESGRRLRDRAPYCSTWAS